MRAHTAPPEPPSLRIEARARAADGATLFPPVAIEAAAGRWTALVGRSGVGKSSILRAVAGLIAPPALDGRVTASDGRPLAGRVAWMGQADALAPWADLAANVALGRRLRGEPVEADRIAAALASVGLGGFERRRPASLSGGQRQRAALARTLVEDRPIVLLDEPFSALDTLTREEMRALARERLEDRTVLLVTHDPEEAALLAESVYALGPGGAEKIERPDGAAVRATLRRLG